MVAQVGRRAGAVIVAVVATLVVLVVTVVPMAQRANAFPCSLGVPCVVTSQSELSDAMQYYMANATGPEVISIGASLGYTTDSIPVVYHSQYNLTIEGNGHTITRSTSDDMFFFYGVAMFGDPVTITINDLTIEGFQSTIGAIDTTTGLYLDNVDFIDNVRTSGDGAAFYAFQATTIVDSTFVGNSSPGGGGAVRVFGNLVVHNSVFHDNSGNQGGAIYGTTVTVTESTFTDNSSHLYGGAIRSSGLTTVEDSLFEGNTSRYGGAIYGQGGVSIADSHFEGNVANSSGLDETGDGGAVYALTSLNITNSSFYDNSAGTNYYGFGGAVRTNPGGTIEDSYFEGNIAGDSGLGGFGGAVYTGGTLTVNRTEFVDNAAGPGPGMNGSGGALSTIAGVINVNQSTFTGNRAGSSGGAINTQADVSLVNSTLVGNSARASGSAVTINSSSLDVFHSTIVDNQSDQDMASLAIYSGDATFEASVLANSNGTPVCLVFFSTATSSGYNYLTDSTCVTPEASDLVGSLDELLLRPFGDYGGATSTLLPRLDSPVIDAIPNGDCTAVTDQRGLTRPAGTGCDIGAVERQAGDSVDPPLAVTLAFDIIDDDSTIVALVTVEGAWDYSNVNWWPTAGYAPTVPADTQFPMGIFGYTFHVPEPGDTVTISLELLVPVTQLWKNIGPDWFLVTDAAITGNTIVYTITDGGALDADGNANSVIVDPVGPGSAVGFTG